MRSSYPRKHSNYTIDAAASFVKIIIAGSLVQFYLTSKKIL